MNIDLERGVDQINFGLTEEQVIEILPDKVGLDRNESRDLLYYRQKLVLKIEPHGRLGWIEVHNQSATWNGVSPWRIEKRSLLDTLETYLSHPAELDDYGVMESYSYGDKFVEL